MLGDGVRYHGEDHGLGDAPPPSQGQRCAHGPDGAEGHGAAGPGEGDDEGGVELGRQEGEGGDEEDGQAADGVGG